MVANTYCYYFGKSHAATKLDSFDGALLDAGIGNVNLVKISSILPPKCKKVSNLNLKPGQILYCAYVNVFSSKSGETLSTAIGVAKPDNKELPSVIMELSCKSSKNESEAIVHQMCVDAMARRSIDNYSIVVKSNEVLSKGPYTCIFGAIGINDE